MPKRRNSGKNNNDWTVYDSKLNASYWKNKSLERIRKWNMFSKHWERETDGEREERLLGQRINIKNAVALETSLQAKMAEEANLEQPITVIEESARGELSFYNTDKPTPTERATKFTLKKSYGAIRDAVTRSSPQTPKDEIPTPEEAEFGEPIVESHEDLTIIEENIIKEGEVIRFGYNLTFGISTKYMNRIGLVIIPFWWRTFEKTWMTKVTSQNRNEYSLLPKSTSP